MSFFSFTEVLWQKRFHLVYYFLLRGKQVFFMHVYLYMYIYIYMYTFTQK